jgi:hypothetical protein
MVIPEPLQLSQVILEKKNYGEGISLNVAAMLS